MGNDHGELAGNPCEEHIRFCGGMVTAPASGGTHIYFEVVDGTFYDGPDLIERPPLVRITLETGEHTEFYVVVSISGASSLAVLHGSLQSHTHWPFAMCTFGHIHLSRSERPFSWQCPAYFMARLLSFNRKRYSRLFQENSHFLDYKGSGLWKSEIHL